MLHLSLKEGIVTGPNIIWNFLHGISHLLANITIGILVCKRILTKLDSCVKRFFLFIWTGRDFSGIIGKLSNAGLSRREAVGFVPLVLP